MTTQKPRPAAPTLREAEADGHTSDVNVDQHLLCTSANADSLPDVPLPNVPLPNVPLPTVPLPVERPDLPVGEEETSPRVAEEACVRDRVRF